MYLKVLCPTLNSILVYTLIDIAISQYTGKKKLQKL